MTATRDRHGDLDDTAAPTWDERPLFGASRGLPWWGAVLLALGLSAVTAAVDVNRQAALGVVYQVGFVLGCVAAVALVRRRSLFGPMVQPPLVFAATAAGALIVFGPSAGGGLKNLLFNVALPLTSNFPLMAITTAVCLALGIVRLFVQRDPARGQGGGRVAAPAGREREARERAAAAAGKRPRPRDGERRPVRKSRPE
ncbi:DUF6542 domain-containing protein [Actinokineospora bangkokensis]|uniref:DUF6542 domain-containing protein n=1 Tax=Actinokineospora bangkokensis TaxID=1193682 RepID=A0A1Q9LDH7_9PSEU|nr:DUF6542 domain-containing protein [Actinokineospora bangkokensis]OLR90066.1 hypothetical protein BJP25_03560 [Actinokineospora bangkokensis]